MNDLTFPLITIVTTELVNGKATVYVFPSQGSKYVCTNVWDLALKLNDSTNSRGIILFHI